MNQSQTSKCVVEARCGGESFLLQIEASNDGVTGCKLLRHGQAEPTAEEDICNPHLVEATKQLCEYFAGKRTELNVMLKPAGTEFQQQVWEAARQIPYGQTRSYWWIAVRIGNPHAARAVGGALGSNPAVIFTPCHRVLRQDGALGGFTGGIEWKQMLLELETNNRQAEVQV